MSSDAHVVGPLAGLRVIELASEHAAYAGKLLADYGAEVLLVEPPGGHDTRRYGPFAEALPVDHPDRSLWFWHYNTSKQSVQLDLHSPADAAQFRQLVGFADIVLEGEAPGRLSALGLDHAHIRGPSTVWVSVTSFGRSDPRSAEPFTDLTAVAGGGLAWSCGYDDHSLPPMAALGNQGYHTASIWAAVGALLAIEGRARTGEGQLVDVSMHAALNVTTEQATQWWLVAGKTVQRQTGRHALHLPSEPIVTLAADGREVHTGFPPRTLDELVKLVRWLDDCDLRERLPLAALLDLAIEQGGMDLAKLYDDEFTQECFRTCREAIMLLAQHHTADEFFLQGQHRGFAVGMILSPEETLADPHLIARGFPTPVHQAQLGHDVVHPGLPIRFTGSPGRITAAPALR
ncbi:MAG: CoA transferase [Actinomycetota bacterium]|nr:CoA transferase [Actinomycetota bacterium]